MKIIIVGCGRIGSGLAMKLSQGDNEIIVIDQEPLTFKHLSTGFKGKTIAGVGFDREVLLTAGIKRTDSLAAVTSNDEANALTARIASQIFGVPRVVSALHEPRKAEIYRRLGLQVFDPMSWGVNRVADLLSFAPVNVAMSIGNGDVDIMEIEIPALLVGRRVGELTIPGEVSVVSISRGNRSIIPVISTVFEDRDLVHLAVATASGERLKSLLGLG
ncbi:NAD-binding protein [Acetobacterium wieringae]|jgi:trk system potassium uptake protein TrkA|uniref:Trk system potassium uptake protein TrkA n=1 Tax=Acetobacterium wieringae TaxID=52694 RepID=A0A1F2PI77_9FIRM|nr:MULTISPECIES: NAD-binding protein [Acetobacterium]HAZ05778.1 potassium transporter TrkA [Acetobacterium sp.]MEA4807574.1 NAD-binding protein [Acetobacterium wieringae]OFV71028.1 Trk system potassium uptake protein TrkA [Acetobacterium wieringae]OXS25657.1 MAG: potassium transporter TrkA [Acetobacterium sp. MES1]TYC84259.1 potassium transporter TrkA [Acetobacterium wieringae]